MSSKQSADKIKGTAYRLLLTAYCLIISVQQRHGWGKLAAAKRFLDASAHRAPKTFEPEGRGSVSRTTRRGA